MKYISTWKQELTNGAHAARLAATTPTTSMAACWQAA